jgi:myo-inositol-1(or 4)-monophosphatase
VAGNPRIYGQLVTTLGKYSKFAGAGDKASVRQAARDAGNDDLPADDGETAPAPVAEKTTLKAKRIKASPATPAVTSQELPDAPF